ncbi:MAG: M20/M25/M40 family metallo-hydrolase [Candidatus Latescibacteria bacterium]|nr:M20/M25/M40 family metallo-hydrolase [Candidatus Latescibacterota bacterium]
MLYRMRHVLCGLIVGLLLSVQPPVHAQSEDETTIKSIFDERLTSGEMYELLRELCKDIGPRLSGSEGAAKAVDWGKQVMETYGFDRVFLQEVMVPHWERGEKEQVQVVNVPEGMIELRALAIGGSVGTPAEGITAEVVIVNSLDEVGALGRDKIEGKIVFYNRAFDQTVVSTGAGYGGAVDQRGGGPSKAAEYGAAAVVIRSVSSAFDDEPHTGGLRYRDGIERIPAAALGFHSADRLTEILKESPDAKLYIRMTSQWHPDARSYNVVGEIRGSEKPDEIILVGGHLDSWDVAEGAHDDGAGCVHAISVLRTFKKLGIRPKHTIRAVLFMNEENGLRGGIKYAELAKANGEKHLVALESDAGGFSPRGFGVSADDRVIDQFRSWLSLFPRNTISYINKGGGGADIGPLRRESGTPTIGFIPDSQRMFDLHHAPTDVFENVNRRELELGAASITSLIYLIDKYGLQGMAQ